MPVTANLVYPNIVEIDTGNGSADTGRIVESAINVAIINNDAALDIFVSTPALVALGFGRIPPGTSKTFGGAGRPLPELAYDANGSTECIITATY